MLRTGTEFLDEILVPSEIFQTTHNLQLLDKVGIVVHYRSPRKLQHVLLTLAYSFQELALLCLAGLALVALIYHYRLEK